MTNKTYRVDLTPLGNYYFGSENTFNATDKGADSKTSVNYLVRSRMYPQQTALLGLMRYVLLLKEGALQEATIRKQELIGTKSFHGIEEGAPSAWGRILSISPLFLRREDNLYLPAGLDYQIYEKERGKHLVQLVADDSRGETKSSFSSLPFALLRGYDAKQLTQLLWKNVSDPNNLITPDYIFVESSQVGITKSFTGERKSDAFYKQYFYKLLNGFSFGFYLTTTAPVKDFNEPIVVPFGADQSLFSVLFTEEENKIFLPEPIGEGNAKITLLSDAYCQPSILANCYLAITNSVDFRYIKTDVDQTKRYYNISAGISDMRKSGKLNLLERGSVLYAEDAGIVLKELEAYPAYRYAGFNHYSIQNL